jgi:hypothetical protein
MVKRLMMSRDERGSALVMALLMAVVGTISLGAAGVLAEGGAREADRVRDDGSALYVAESGVNDGLHRLRFQSQALIFRQYPQDLPSFSGGPDRVGPGGSYDVWIWPDAADPSVKHMVAVGSMGSMRRLVRVQVIIVQPDPFSPATGGPELTPPEQAAVPMVTRPNIPCGGFLRLSGRDVLVLGNANGTPAHYCYTGIQISGQAQIVVLGPVHIWVSGNIQISGTADINAFGPPTWLLIWVPGTTEISINLSGTSLFRGGIWAPYSTLRVSGTADLVGAVVVEDIIISGQGEIEDVLTYDPGMGDIPWPAGTPVDRKWRDYQ